MTFLETGRKSYSVQTTIYVLICRVELSALLEDVMHKYYLVKKTTGMNKNNTNNNSSSSSSNNNNNNNTLLALCSGQCFAHVWEGGGKVRPQRIRLISWRVQRSVWRSCQENFRWPVADLVWKPPYPGYSWKMNLLVIKHPVVLPPWSHGWTT